MLQLGVPATTKTRSGPVADRAALTGSAAGNDHPAPNSTTANRMVTETRTRRTVRRVMTEAAVPG